MVRISGEFALGETQVVQASSPDLFVANMVAQILGGSRPLFYNHLVKCMEYVGNFAKEQNAKIMCPMFGSALAGGDWKFIEQLIEDIWLTKDIDVTVFYLNSSFILNYFSIAEKDLSQRIAMHNNTSFCVSNGLPTKSEIKS